MDLEAIAQGVAEKMQENPGGDNNQQNTAQENNTQNNNQQADPGNQNAQQNNWELPLDKFNEWSGGQFKDANEIKERLTKDYSSEIKSWEDKYNGLKSENDKIMQEVQSMIDNNDPLKRDFNGDVDAYKRWRVETELSNGRDKSVVARLMNSEIDKISDVEAISLYHQFVSPSLSGQDDITKQVAYKNAGVDFDTYKEQYEKDFDINNPELSQIQKAQLAIKGSEAKQFLSNAINEASGKVTIPDTKNFQENIKAKIQQENEAKQNLQNNWKESKTKIQDKLKELTFSKENDKGEKLFEHTYSLNQDTLDKVGETAIKYAFDNGIELTEENLDKVVNSAKRVVLEERINDIIYAALEQQKAKDYEENHNRAHNNQPINKNEAPNNEKDPIKKDIQSALKQFGVLK